MEAIRNRLKTIALVLTALLLFQSCVVYHKTPTTLEKASQEHIKTKVVNVNGETAKYKHIVYEDKVFYGVIEKSGELTKEILSPSNISEIFTKNQSKSEALTWTTSILIAIPVTVVIIMIAAFDPI